MMDEFVDIKLGNDMLSMQEVCQFLDKFNINLFDILTNPATKLKFNMWLDEFSMEK